MIIIFQTLLGKVNLFNTILKVTQRFHTKHCTMINEYFWSSNDGVIFTNLLSSFRFYDLKFKYNLYFIIFFTKCINLFLHKLLFGK